MSWLCLKLYSPCCTNNNLKHIKRRNIYRFLWNNWKTPILTQSTSMYRWKFNVRFYQILKNHWCAMNISIVCTQKVEVVVGRSEVWFRALSRNSWLDVFVVREVFMDSRLCCWINLVFNVAFKRILLVKPSGRKGLSFSFDLIPLGLEYIAAYIKDTVEKVDIVDMELDRRKFQDCLQFYRCLLYTSDAADE